MEQGVPMEAWDHQVTVACWEPHHLSAVSEACLGLPMAAPPLSVVLAVPMAAPPLLVGTGACTEVLPHPLELVAPMDPQDTLGPLLSLAHLVSVALDTLVSLAPLLVSAVPATLVCLAPLVSVALGTLVSLAPLVLAGLDTLVFQVPLLVGLAWAVTQPEPVDLDTETRDSMSM